MSSARTPPRFVPTLTEVVHPRTAAAVPAVPAVPAGRAVLAALSDEQLVHRIIQRVELTLEKRLREAIATTVLQQTQVLESLLHEEVGLVVRDSVRQALAEELRASQGAVQQT